tara:strand:+ start:886 stop:1629 length:744 start_codon:yes stop_codon:yes gene_type:complete
MANKTIPTNVGNSTDKAIDSTEETSLVVEIPRHIEEARQAFALFNDTHGSDIEKAGSALDEIFLVAYAENTADGYSDFHDEFSRLFRRQSYLAIYKAGSMASTATFLHSLKALASVLPKAYSGLSNDLRDATTDYQISRNGSIMAATAKALADADAKGKIEICETIQAWILRGEKEMSDFTKSTTFSNAMDSVGIKASTNSKANKKNKKGPITKGDKSSKMTASDVIKAFNALSKADKETVKAHVNK